MLTKDKLTILHITPFFSPNIGGVETHLTDLVSSLAHLNYKNIVLTYSPITSPNTKYNRIEISKNIFIRRFPMIGFNLFTELERYPLLNFFYLTPYLLTRSILFLLISKPKFNIIHAHGINAAIIGLIIKNIYHKKLIVSIYSSYDNVPLNSISTNLIIKILNSCDIVLTQSDKSICQLQKLGINKSKLFRYKHWIDTNRFKPIVTTKSFSVLFVGRMIPSKNALLLAKVSKYFPNITFNFIGIGPEYSNLQKISKKYKNINLLGNIPYTELHKYYASASLLCIPSKYDEGWGRVIMESISCGTPVIASNYGAIPEVVDTSVAVLINPTANHIKTSISKLFTDKEYYNQLKNNCRNFALKRFSVKNLSYITRHY